MPVIDLHMHSTASDGSLAPAAVVARAAGRGVQLLALTDHDTLAGQAEAQAAGAELGVRVLTGVELSLDWQGQTVHVVGLDFDPEHNVIAPLLAGLAQERARRAEEIAAKLAKCGIRGAFEGALALAGAPERISRTHIARWLVDAGVVRDPQQAFDWYLGKGKPAAVPSRWPALAGGVAAIVESGGVAVLAHPSRYKLGSGALRQLLAAFKAAGGVAMEVASPNLPRGMMDKLARTAHQAGLEASQGSDFHGAPMPWVELGRFPELPALCQPVWQRWA